MRKPFAQAAKGDEEIRYLLPHLYSPTRAARALVRTLRVELEARPTSGLRQRTLYRRPQAPTKSITLGPTRYPGTGHIPGRRNQNEIISAGGSGKCLDLIT